MIATSIFATLVVLSAGFVAVGARALDRANRRELGGRGRFLSAFDGEGLPAELLVQAYETLSRRVGPNVRDIRPSDRLGPGFGLTEMDVEDVALLVAARSDARIPTSHDLDELDLRVETVADLVRFLAPFCAPSPVRHVLVR